MVSGKESQGFSSSQLKLTIEDQLETKVRESHLILMDVTIWILLMDMYVHL